MGKKSEKSKGGADSARAVKPAAKKSKKVAVIAEPVAPVMETIVAKPARTPAKKAATKATAPKAASKPSYTQDDIALRAYFISEKRQQAGISGDAHQDWLEAERQLLSENGKKKPVAKRA